MSDDFTVTRKVLIAHLQSFIADDTPFTLSSDQTTIINYVIDCLNKKIHPSTLLTDQAKLSFRKLTNLDIDLLKIADIPLPDNNQTIESLFSKLIKVAVVAQTNTSCCSYFSCAQNLSSNYNYANVVDVPTCSHPDSPYGINCAYFANGQPSCPQYKSDSYNQTYTIDDLTYHVSYSRTIQGSKNVVIKDSSDNTVQELSYPMTEFFEVGYDKLYQEVSSVIKEYHRLLTTSSTGSVDLSIESSELESSKSSYISTLIS